MNSNKTYIPKMKFIPYAKTILCLILSIILIISFLPGCNTQQKFNKVFIGQLPNTVVENSVVCDEYYDISEQLSADLIDEFIDITQVPHPTAYQDKIFEYLQNKLKAYGITPNIDPMSQSIYADIPASSNAEANNIPAVILQAHMDMIPVSSEESNFNFYTDPINVEYDVLFDQIYSKDYQTNIGADDGQGMALMLTLAKNKDNYEHGRIRLIFTKDKETTTRGAYTLDPSVLNADYFINLDGMQIGNVICSSAGMVKGTLSCNLPVSTVEPNESLISVTWDGLAGGHTGIDVDKLRIHASEAIVEYFNLLSQNNIPYKIANIECGNIANAYPSTFTIKYYLNEQYFDMAEDLANAKYEEYREYMEDEEDFSLEVNVEESNLLPLSYNDSVEMINTLDEIPEGVLEKSDLRDDIPITSNACGILSLENGRLTTSYLIRSSSNDSLDTYEQWIQNFARENELELYDTSRMNGWDYDENNKLAQIFLDSYKYVGSFEGEKTIIHGGLEASHFIQKKPTLQMVSIGLDYSGEHEEDETIYTNTIDMYIASVLYTLKHLS